LSVATSKKTRQGLKLTRPIIFYFIIEAVATSKKTRQGLKHLNALQEHCARNRCNEQENPTGIETERKGFCDHNQIWCCNEQENPTGIETEMRQACREWKGPRCNEQENPTGIETQALDHLSR